MVTVINRSGVRTVVLHRGLRGVDGVQGEPGDVTGPVSSTDSAIALFDGAGGNQIKDSATLLSALATAANLTAGLALKEDKVPGWGLSEENLTSALLAKLTALSPSTFRGSYADLITLQSTLATGNPGDYAYVEASSDELLVYHWDDTNSAWTLQAPGSAVLDGAAISALLFAESDTNNFTDVYKALVDGAVQDSVFNAVVAEFEAAIGISFNNVTVEATAARTLSTPDSGRYIRLTNAAGCTITLPNDAAASWVDNNQIEFVITVATLPTITLGGGVTLNNSSALATLAQWDGFRLKRVAADEWDLTVFKA